MIRYVSLEGFVVELEAIGFHVRDLGLVHSALARPATALLGADAYDSIDLKAAAQTESLARNHPFMDGNKRPAWIALNHFLHINGCLLFRPRMMPSTTSRVSRRGDYRSRNPPPGSSRIAAPFDTVPRPWPDLLSN